MGTDIHSRAERRVGGEWQVIPGLRPFMSGRSYRWWGFLADVRNSAAIEPISPPRGLPPGVVAPSEDEEMEDEVTDGAFLGAHSFSWLSVNELLRFNYEQIVEDRRFSGVVDGKIGGEFTSPSGTGNRMTLREFLQPHFFTELAELRQADADQVVFGFSD